MHDETLIKPIFIICQHRTGSTLLKNMLDQSSDLSMATDEMAISCPWRKSFLDLIEEISYLNSDKSIEKIVEIIFSGKVYGRFWRDYPNLGISRDVIKNRISASNRSAKSIISILLDEYMKYRSKNRVGVKYFVHYSRIDIIYKWYSDCKIIFLTRDPRAMIASKLFSKGTISRKQKYKNPVAKHIIHFLTLLYAVIEFNRISKTYWKYYHHGNIYHCTYENLIINSEKTLKSICKFCEIEYSREMLCAQGKYSSHGEPIIDGPDVKRLNLWKKRLSQFELLIINFFSKKAMYRFGYQKSGHLYG